MSTQVFKGCTRQPSVLGVPMTPLVLCVGGFLILGIWVWIPLALGMIPTIMVLRSMSAHDDQIFRLLGLHLQLNVIGNPNRFFWRGLTSLNPRQKNEPLCCIEKNRRQSQ